jgi:DNA repair exonuclease SbcCD ATPase subunit
MFKNTDQNKIKVKTIAKQYLRREIAGCLGKLFCATPENQRANLPDILFADKPVAQICLDAQKIVPINADLRKAIEDFRKHFIDQADMRMEDCYNRLNGAHIDRDKYFKIVFEILYTVAELIEVTEALHEDQIKQAQAETQKAIEKSREMVQEKQRLELENAQTYGQLAVARKKEVELEKSVKASEKKIAELKSEQNAAFEVVQQQSIINTKLRAEVAVRDIPQEFDGLRKELGALEQKFTLAKKELSELQIKLNRCLDRSKHLCKKEKEELSKLTQARENLRIKILQLQETIQNNKEAELFDDLSRLKIERDSTIAEEKKYDDQISSKEKVIKHKTTKAKIEIDALKKNITEITENMAHLSEEIDAKKQLIAGREQTFLSCQNLVKPKPGQSSKASSSPLSSCGMFANNGANSARKSYDQTASPSLPNPSKDSLEDQQLLKPVDESVKFDQSLAEKFAASDLSKFTTKFK